MFCMQRRKSVTTQVQVRSRTKTAQKSKHTFRFVDLFCGIGGFHVAAKKLGGKCVFACDIDDEARKSYEINHRIKIGSDITKIRASDVPNHDILFAGFPCQPFSIIGKKLGLDDTRGTLFYDILRIIHTKQPKMALLENVKQFATHDGGKTIDMLVELLAKEGYSTKIQILNALDHGLPQKRERTIIVCFRNKSYANEFCFPEKLKKYTPLSRILETNVEDKYYASDHIRKKRHHKHASKHILSIWHENKGGMVNSYPYSCALRAGASHNYLLVNGERRLTPREMLRLQGFPNSFKIVCNYTNTRHQVGNAVPVPMIYRVVKQMLPFLVKYRRS